MPYAVVVYLPLVLRIVHQDFPDIMEKTGQLQFIDGNVLRNILTEVGSHICLIQHHGAFQGIEGVLAQPSPVIPMILACGGGGEEIRLVQPCDKVVHPLSRYGLEFREELLPVL